LCTLRISEIRDDIYEKMYFLKFLNLKL